MKANSQKQYYDELSKGIQDKKRNQHFERMMHDNDTNVMQVKKQETDFIHQGLKDRQKEEKYMLGQIYQNQISQARQLRDNEKAVEKELERVQIERMKGIDPDAYNKLKKKAYRHELKQELDQKNKLKQYDKAMREQSMRENRKLMDDYARREISNEQDYRNKFINFDNNMMKRMKDYNNHVMKPHLQKEANKSMIESKNINEYNKRLENDEMNQFNRRKMQIMETSLEQKNQMFEKAKNSNLQAQIGQLENDRTNERIFEISSFDNMLKEDKKKRQEMYRQMLNSQIQYNNGLKAFGNMTRVEKEMNKDDLKAYKRHDNTQYGLIPGINNEKRYPKESSAKKDQLSYDEQQRRLEAYGYGRYLKKAPTQFSIDNLNSSVTNNARASSKAFNAMNRSYTGGYDNGAAVQNVNEVPNSRRNINLGISPRSPLPKTLRNAGALTVSRDQQRVDQRPAGSPSGMQNPYRNQVL